MPDSQRPQPPLSTEARGLMSAGLTPLAYVERLLAKGLHEDALVFSAYVLPARDLAWWGCLCAWKKARPEPAPPEAEALRASLRWIQKPGEETRRAAADAARTAGLATPAGVVAQAVFYSGGNLSAPELPAVQATPELMSETIVNALRLASALEDPVRLDRCFRRYVLFAMEPLRRLSTRPAPPPDPGSLDGSVASRWSDDQTAQGELSPLPKAPPLRQPTPKPAPPSNRRSTKPDNRPESEKDAWEGLTQFGDE